MINRRNFLKYSGAALALGALGVKITTAKEDILFFKDLQPLEMFNVLSDPGVDRYTEETPFLKYGDFSCRRWTLSNCIDVHRNAGYTLSPDTVVRKTTKCCRFTSLHQKQAVDIKFDHCRCCDCHAQFSYHGTLPGRQERIRGTVEIRCDICLKTKSNSGKPFTEETILQHVRDAHDRDIGDPTFELTDLIADDEMPDGAYFALAMELGEL